MSMSSRTRSGSPRCARCMADDRSGHDQQRGMPEATQLIPSPRSTLATDIPDLRLVALSPHDAEAYYDLVDRNRSHLTQHGDWTELGEATPESVAASLNTLNNPATQFGIWFDRQLVGRVDLNPRTPGNFVLGYWLGGEYTGKGYATAACKALIAYGKAVLGEPRYRRSAERLRAEMRA